MKRTRVDREEEEEEKEEEEEEEEEEEVKEKESDIRGTYSWAPIKAEYIIPRSNNNNNDDNADDENDDEDEGVDPDRVQGNDEDDNDGEGKSSSSPSNKKVKGMNRNRPKKNPKSGDNYKSWCVDVQNGRPCRYGSRCFSEHDPLVFLASKPADITAGGLSCPFFDAVGSCRFGIACRLGGPHIDAATGKSLTKQVDNNNNHNVVSKAMNAIDGQTMFRLRKRQYEFPTATAWLALLKQSEEMEKTDQQIVSKSSRRRMKKKMRLTRQRQQQQEDEAEIKGNNNNNNNNSAAETDRGWLSSVVSYLRAITGYDSPVVNNSNEKDDDDNYDEEPQPKQQQQQQAQQQQQQHHHQQLLQQQQQREEERQRFVETRLKPNETRRIDLRGKLYLAPLTTTGNLPFRRLCKRYGADVTCGEMALASAILQGSASELALLKRHPSEDLFGVQLAGPSAETMVRAAEFIRDNTAVDFVDINAGCPVELFCDMGVGASLMAKRAKMRAMLQGMSTVLADTCAVTIKMRVGLTSLKPNAHKLVPDLFRWGASAVTIHGRSKQQRYSKLADWAYVDRCAALADPRMAVIGNGDVFSYEDYERHLHHRYTDYLPADNSNNNNNNNNNNNFVNKKSDDEDEEDEEEEVTKQRELTTVLIARGALIKPWLFQEIKERRHIDVRSSERLEMLREYVRFGLEHWGSDDSGVNKTRRFLLELLSFTHRYIPIGLLERMPPAMNEKALPYRGRDELETLMASNKVADWLRISELLLGPVPSNFEFVPKHKANA